MFSTDMDQNCAPLCIVSPDAGGVGRARAFQQGLVRHWDMNPSMAMVIKQRRSAGVIASMDLVGSVNGCDCIIVDDMIDTAGTLCKAAQELKTFGARKVFAFASHGLFNGPASDRIKKSVIEEGTCLLFPSWFYFTSLKPFHTSTT